MPMIAQTIIGIIVLAFRYFVIRMFIGFGLTVGSFIGLEYVFHWVVARIQESIGSITSIQYGGYTLDVVGLLGAAGVWSAINIILSGYAGVFMIKSVRTFVFKQS